MHQLAAYLKEREGFDSIIKDEGFAAYRIEGDTCQIYDIFVHSDYRMKNIATEMAQEIEAIAKRSGCTYLTGTTITTGRNSTESVKFILSYGMKIHGTVQNAIIFRKELE